MQPLLISLLIFVAVGTILYGMAQMRTQGQGREALKGRLANKPTVSVDDPTTPSIVRDVSYSNIPALNKLLQGQRFSGALRVWLLQARVNMPPGTIVLSCLLLGTIGFYAMQFTFGRPIPMAIGTAFGLYLPVSLINRRRRKRFAAFGRQLPDALTMMKNSLRAGHTLNKAMQIVSEEMPDPIALEFAETVEELHLGVPTKRAFKNLCTRVREQNLDIFVAALLVQREVGGNLNELLGNLAGTIRERFRIDQEVMALTAEGRFSGWVVGALPIGLMIVINLMQPEYMEPLFHTEQGIKLLKVAFALEVTGFFFINKACKVNF